MKLVIVAVCCLAITSIMASKEQPTEAELGEWQSFKATHSKSYEGAEDQRRLGIFLANKAKIEEHNKRYEQGLETYSQGINQFADLEHDEFVNRHTGYRPPKE